LLGVGVGVGVWWRGGVRWPRFRACGQAVVGRPVVPVMWSQITKRVVMALSR
jgi:hypothetical protein